MRLFQQVVVLVVMIILTTKPICCFIISISESVKYSKIVKYDVINSDVRISVFLIYRRKIIYDRESKYRMEAIMA